MSERCIHHLLALQPFVCCPRCANTLSIKENNFFCNSCRYEFVSVGNVPCLLPNSETARLHWRQQMAQINLEGAMTLQSFKVELNKPALIPATVQRLLKQIELTQRVMLEVDNILTPILGDPIKSEQPIQAYKLLENLHYLFRDWGWPDSKETDNAFELTAKSIEQSTQQSTQQSIQKPIETLLVVATGASRLAYDIRVAGIAKKVIVLDIDPLLLVVSEKIINGESIQLTETRSNATELTRMSEVRRLTAPQGAITGIHPLLANGLNIPLQNESVDAILIPWFSDLVGDMRNFIGNLDPVLKPNGKWIHYGPLLYPTSVPAALRYSREEIFQLLEMAGYEINSHHKSAAHFSYSPLTERGRIEPVFSFCATKLTKPEINNHLPAWLVFTHLPVPDFAGRAQFQHTNPAFEAIIKLIDGERTLRDLTHCVQKIVGSYSEAMMDAIRHCLLECHPYLISIK